jgi:transposase InsO family protein
LIGKFAALSRNHSTIRTPNLMQREFTVNQPDRVYVSDITYIWTSQGWLYLAVTIDLFSRAKVKRRRLSLSWMLPAYLHRLPSC